jgi:putative oxidoreductase
MLLTLSSTDPDWIQTIIRIALGIVFFVHGAQSLLGWFGGPSLRETRSRMPEFPTLPIPLTSAAMFAEFFGGLGLIVGLLSRVDAFGIGIIMLSVIVTHERQRAFLNWFAGREGHGYECHLLAIALAAAIVVRGAGAVSLDRLLYISMSA